jgi:hypothetical protein
LFYRRSAASISAPEIPDEPKIDTVSYFVMTKELSVPTFPTLPA